MDQASPKLTALCATALEAVALAGRLVMYPSGLWQEAPAPRAPSDIPGPRPVLLLHGFVDNRSVFALLRRSLARNGWQQVVCLNYSPLTCDVRTAAESLGRSIEELCAVTGHQQVDVVGHSLGGLIARYYAQRLAGDTRVHTLVTLGTPHSGTSAAAPLSVHPIVRQMRPGSELIEELAAPAPGCATRFVSFWSDVDRVMAPVLTARLDHPDLLVRTVRVQGVGHLAMPAHWAVAARVRQELQEALPGVPKAGPAYGIA
ncbi:alpha/beta fold hydrolase [Streptomyces sp. 549]|uniref:alpha/beta fold hydrolase n=1 Tax=Streptomyces sp. 549 TaxID=3049076 RepID=UPI0024C3959A|nr:alpha/beta fold hydrolase [Streptomyces sp. 549]MDK1472791.1 alpha/beta fold hydrolase [Streptomyces sp. 549]